MNAPLNPVIGRTRKLPYDVDVEQALIGAVLVDNVMFDVAAEALTDAEFYDPMHQRLWRTIGALIEAGAAATPLTVKASMNGDAGLEEVGGLTYLVSLARAAPAMPNVGDYARILAEFASRRELIRIGETLAEEALDGRTAATALAQGVERAIQEVSGETGERKRIEASGFVWVQPSSLPPREWLGSNKHQIRKFPTGTISTGGIGKSNFTIAEGLAAVTGRPLLRHSFPKRLRVWLWNLEDPKDEIDRRIAAACLHYGITTGDIGDRLFVDSGRDMPCTIARSDGDGTFIVQPVADRILSVLQAKKIDSLTIDPFVSCHRVPENDNGSVDMVAKEWGRIADKANCSIELIHHVRKVGDREMDADDARGGGSMVAALRSLRVFNPMTEEQAKQAGVENARRYFRVSMGKQNLAPPADTSEWFRLASVELGNGDNVGVVTPWEWPDPFDGMSTRDLFAIQKTIQSGQWKASPQAKDWAGVAIARHLNLDLNDESAKARCRSLLKRWLASGALCEVRRQDETRHERPFIEVGQWAVD